MSAIAFEEFVAPKGDVELHIYRKRRDDLGVDAPVLFLVHGSSLSSLPSFDLKVPGRDDYSLMDAFARLGYDVWTMDHECYGRSTRTERNANVAMGADDLTVATAVVERETGHGSVMMYGQSSGALRAGLFANRMPQRVERLILDAFTWTGRDAPTLIKRAENLDYFRSHSYRRVDRAFFHSIITRDKPGTSEEIVGDAMAEAELAMGDMIPTGTYLDMCANLPLVDPARIACPILIVRGEHDGIATDEDIANFFAALATKDKHLAVVAGQSHASTLGINRHRLIHIMHCFLTLPARRDEPAG